MYLPSAVQTGVYRLTYHLVFHTLFKMPWIIAFIRQEVNQIAFAASQPRLNGKSAHNQTAKFTAVPQLLKCVVYLPFSSPYKNSLLFVEVAALQQNTIDFVSMAKCY